MRTVGGMFDVSHMGRVKVTGRHARRFLERLCTRRISDMEPGQCRYSLVCNASGGVRDDVLVYKIDDDDYLIVVNASNREKLLKHFDEIKGDLVVKIEDRTMQTAMVALQEDAPVIPVAIHGTQTWKPGNFRPVSVAWGEPMRFDGLPKGGRGYKEASLYVQAEIRRLFDWLVDAHRLGRPDGVPPGTEPR